MIAPRLTPTIDAPMREFLQWLARDTRTYAETMDAWASHCPRFTVWEDALAGGLVRVDATEACIDGARVTLTSAGCAALARRGAP